MKKLNLLPLCMFLCISHIAVSQDVTEWEVVHTLDADQVQGVLNISSVGDSVIWALSANSSYDIPLTWLAISLDGGESWDTKTIDVNLPSNPTFKISNIFAVNSTTAWICLSGLLERGWILKTTDGGQTWENIEIPEVNDILSYKCPIGIHFFNENDGIFFTTTNATLLNNRFILNDTATLGVFTTIDGGQTWGETTPELIDGEGLYFNGPGNFFETSGDTVWVGTRFGRILRSLDKGQQWEIFQTGIYTENINEIDPDNANLESANVNSIAFENSQTGMAIQTYDIGFFPGPTKGVKTTDGGQTWERIPSPYSGHNVTTIPGMDDGYLMYNGAMIAPISDPEILISINGGTNWARFITYPYLAMDIKSPTRAFAGGGVGDGQIYKYTGGSLDNLPAFLSIFRTEGQGQNILPPDYYITDVAEIDQQLVWAVAAASTLEEDLPLDHKIIVLRSEDGGQNWESFPVDEAPGRISLNIFAFDKNKVWITTSDFGNGAGAGLFESRNGGLDWEEKLSHPAGNAWIHFYDDDHGITISNDRMAKTTDGGQNWTVQNTIPTFSEEGVYPEVRSIFSGDNGYAIQNNSIWFGTNHGKIYKSTDRGETWSVQQVLDENDYIHSISFKNELEGMAVSSYEGLLTPKPPQILTTTDGGISWQVSDFIIPLRNISYINNSSSIIGVNDNLELCVRSDDGGNNWYYIRDVRAFGDISITSDFYCWMTHAKRNEHTYPPIYKWKGSLVTSSESAVSLDHQAPQIKIFPNPVVDQFFVQAEHKISFATLLDTSGKRLTSLRQETPKQWTGQIGYLPAGIYWLEVISDQNRSLHKIIKH